MTNTASNTKTDVSVMSDVSYIRKSSTLITEALHKGCHVFQTAEGDIFITETKVVTFHYTWDTKKGKMVRVNNGGRIKKVRRKSDDDILNTEDLIDDLA